MAMNKPRLITIFHGEDDSIAIDVEGAPDMGMVLRPGESWTWKNRSRPGEQVTVSFSIVDPDAFDWRCPDCRCWNFPTHAFCYRCGAGQPHVGDEDPG